MKKLNFLAALLVSALAFFATSCESDNTTDAPDTVTPKAITLSISGGESVTVDGKDETKEVTITASDIADRDILVTLTPENAKEGEVTFASNRLLLVAGTQSVKTLVAFTAEGFPADAAEKNIGITISSTAEYVTISTDKTATFAVKGIDGPEMVKLSFTTPAGSTFDMTKGLPANVEILFTLGKELDFDLPITIKYATDSPIQSTGAWSPFPMVIPKGQLAATQSISVNAGTTGEMKLKMNLEPGENVKLEEDKVTFIFLKYEAQIAALARNVKVPKDADVTRTFTVSLTNPAIKPVTVKLGFEGDSNGATLDEQQVSFAVGEQSKQAYVTFSKEVFNSYLATKKITVNITSDDVPVTGSKCSVDYTVAGARAESEKEQLNLFIKVENTPNHPEPNPAAIDLPYGDKNDRYDFYIGGKQDIAQVMPVIPLLVTIEGFDPADWSCSSIDAEGIYPLTPQIDTNPDPDYNGKVKLDNWLFNIRFQPSAKGKTGRIVFTSDDATISTQGAITVKVAP